MFTGPDGPNVFGMPLDHSGSWRFRNHVWSKFKYSVFPFWEPQHEVLSLRYGTLALATMPPVFAGLVNSRILDLHGLPNARLLLRTPTCLVAGSMGGFLTWATQSYFVESDIIVGT